MLSVQGASDLTLYAVVIAAVVQDLRSCRISNRLLLTAFLFSLAFGFLLGGAPRVVWVLWKALVPVILLYLLYLLGALGAGDVKLFSIICGFTNFKVFTDCLLAAFAAGAVIALVRLLRNRCLLPSLLQAFWFLRKTAGGEVSSYRKEWADEKNLIHFSVPILIGLIAAKVLAAA